MLNIKLPKGKVARALMECADAYADVAKAERATFHKDIEVWRKDMNFVPGRDAGGAALPPSGPSRATKDKALKFMEMAAACTYSTGDVYVSAELWTEIKGYYDG